MRFWRQISLLVWLSSCAGIALAQDGWSSSLLDQLKEPPKPSVTQQATASDGMVLKTYRLDHLKVGEAGRSAQAISTLKRLLPMGSEVRPDMQANSLHVLTTPRAHEGAWEFLSAMDVEIQSAAPTQDPAQAEAIAKATAKLEQAATASQQALAQVAGIQTSLQSGMDSKFSSFQNSIRKIIVVAGIAIVVFVAALVYLLARRRRRAESEAAVVGDGYSPMSTALTLTPEAAQTALEPVQREMQTKMMELLNATAIKMQSVVEAQKREHAENASRLTALIQKAGEDMQAAQIRVEEFADSQHKALKGIHAIGERLDSGLAEFQKSSDKVEAVAAELARTMKELDAQRDHAAKLASEMAAMQAKAQLEAKDAEAMRRLIAQKEQELLKKEREITNQAASLAALQIMLDGGDPIPAGAVQEQVDVQSARLDEPTVLPTSSLDISEIPPSDAIGVAPPPPATERAFVFHDPEEPGSLPDNT